MVAVGLLLPEGFATLSFAPLAVFEAANMVLAEPFYELHLVSDVGGRVANSFGVATETERAEDIALDTLLLGAPPDTRAPSTALVEYLKRSSGQYRRIASICVGAFILGEAGLLDGRRVTTHWKFARELQVRYPSARVEVDRIFIADGQIWTSAGMTAGIDLALSLVERDIGPDKARKIAQMMVMYHRRSGGQSQYSALLEMDAKSDRVQDALSYARSHLVDDLSVEVLAATACLSPRQFSRVFQKETGLSPARAIENLRLEAARLMLEQGRLPIDAIAREAGFGDRERMRRSFLRRFGLTPQAIRQTSEPLAAI